MLIPSVDEIKLQFKNEIISRHPKIRDFSSGSMLDILNEAYAIQCNLLYQRIENAKNSVSILTATGSDLDDLVVDRLPEGRQRGTHSTGYLTFKRIYPATEAVPIPEGSKALALDADGTKHYFETTAYAEIPVGDTSVVVEARSFEPGSDTNVAAYSINQLPYAIEGVDRVENVYAFSGGTDDESDDDLRTRYYYAVLVPGKATTEIITEHLTDLESVSEAHIYPRSNGDIQVVVDYDGGMQEDSTEIYNVLYSDVAAGIVCRGAIGADIRSGVATVLISEVAGGKIFVRATSNALSGDSINISYVDILGRNRSATASIPENTITGDVIEAVLESSTDRATKITDIGYLGTNSYDILIGLGSYPYLYLLPRNVPINISVVIEQTLTPENDLTDNIKSSLESFLDSYRIGEDLEWSDVFKYIYRDYLTDRAFDGIDTIISCSITGNGVTITGPGQEINIEEDQRIRNGEVSVTHT